METNRNDNNTMAIQPLNEQKHMLYINRILRLVLPTFLIGGTLTAQQPLPAPYGASTVTNSVRTWTARRPFVNESDIVAVANITEAQQNTRYYDGLGRPMQSVLKQGSPLGNDMVTVNTYNSIGQEQFLYLSFTSNVATTGDQTTDGNFKADAFQQQAAFYNTLLTGQTEETNVGSSSLNWAYSQDIYEASPLNRITTSYSPGASWVGSQSTGTPHRALQQSVVNTATDNVQIWTMAAWSIASPETNIIPTDAGTYAAGQLYKTISTDEQGHQVIEFTDKYGQVVLKKVQLSATADNGSGSGYTGWISTYYVYDDRGSLRFVITPDLVTTMAASGTWTISLTQADELCFRMEYDLQNHMIVKKTPGTQSGTLGEVWSVYDQRNRLVMRQDGNLRGLHKWEYFQYDNLDRPIAKGLITDPTNYNNLSYHVTNAATSSNSGGVSAWPVVSSYTSELLSKNFYDNYTNIPSPLSQTIDASTNGTGYASFSTSYNTSPSFAQPMTSTIMTQGMSTGITDEVLGSGGGQYIVSVNFYDDKGRTIQTQSTNITGGKDIMTTQYDWSGKGLSSLLTHNYTSPTTPQTHKVYTAMTYDGAGRLLTVVKTVNSTVTTAGVAATVTSPATTLVSNQYDEGGRILKKTLGSSLETLTYEYNVRGWPLGVNRGYLSGSSSNYFGMELAYDKTTASAPGTSYLYASTNGNVAGQIWKSKGDGIARKYDYNYDNTNRLSAAPFLQSSSSGVWDKSYVDFSVGSIGYDANGNINAMSQNGFVQGGSGPIDNLSYNYIGGPGTSNRLQNVTDGVNVPNSTLGDFHYPGTSKSGTSTDYGYDANGNVTSDFNRSISSLVYYDAPNLPKTITTPKGTISYYYDASGAKLRKLVTENGLTINGIATNLNTTTIYDGAFVYKTVSYTAAALASLNYTDILQFIGTEEGRIRFKRMVGSVPASFVHDYIIADHLGNARVGLTDESQQDIYPAATGETDTYNGGVAQNYEAQYYSFTPSDFVTTSSLGTWYSSMTGTGYLNQNGSGIPTNTVDPYSNVSVASTKVYQSCGNTANNPSGNRFGLGIALKVMAGDQVSIYGKSFWHNSSGTLPTGSYPVSAVLSSLLGAFGSSTAVVGAGHPLLNGVPFNSSTSSPTATLLNPMLPTSSSQSGTQAPYAGISWIIFDDQFRPISVGFDPVSTTTDNVKSHTPAAITAPANGYIYVYVSNQSNLNVYFDNLQAVHTRGPLLEESHYYPNGLTMAGISDRAWNKTPNNFHYQGKEMQNQEWYDGSGLEEYDFAARLYDPQIGRWSAQDPASQFASPYLAMANNWMRGTDPSGKIFGIDDAIIDAAIISAIVSSASYVAMNFVAGNSWNGLTLKGFLGAAAMGAVSGAASAGLTELGTSLFSASFAQSFGYNFMTNMAMSSALTAAQGKPLTWGGVIGSAVGAMVDGSLPNFKGFESGETYSFGDGLLNGIGELAANGGKGAIAGGIGGGVGAAIDGGDVGSGFVNGAKYGAISAGIRTGVNIAVLGPTIRPNAYITGQLRAMEADLNIKLIDDPYGPVYRIGGFWQRGLSVGLTHMINAGDDRASFAQNINDADTWIHESYHYYQYLTQGWSVQLMNGAYEQYILNGREDIYHDCNTNEGQAQWYEDHRAYK
jgi:RHS repeat-associated protein